MGAGEPSLIPPNAYTYVLITLFLAQLQIGMALQPKLSLRRQWMGLRPKYNILGLGRGKLWIACPVDFL